ncbi:MAG: ABC transporter permease [Thermoleophilia bacterium]|nr:ABC transporter permease [Thermoleophilia bacterium]
MDATTDRSVRPPLLRLGAVEARKMVDTRAAMWLLILTALSAVAAVVVGAFVDDGNRDFGELFVDAMLAASVLMPIVPILLVTGEWSQRTALETFTLVPVRERVMAAKLVAVVALLVAFTALCLGLAALAVAAGGDGLGFDAAEGGQAVLYVLLSLLFGFGLAAAIMSSAAAIVLYFAVQILIAAIAAISSGIESVVGWIDPDAWTSLTDSPAPEWDRIATAAIAWVLVPLALGLIRLRRRDVS